jgi:uncharacterized protein
VLDRTEHRPWPLPTGPVVDGLAVEAARRLFRLPYYHARLRLKGSGDRIECDNARRGGDRTHVFSASYAPAGDVFEPESGSLEYFLTER